MSQPYFSIIVPTYNRAAALGKTLATIQAQTFRDFEVVIVDDGSTDATADRITVFLDDSRIRYVTKPNGGAASARNHGLSLALGQVIVYCDSDDSLHPDFLETHAVFYQGDPTLNFSICNHRRTVTLVDDQGQVLATRDETRAPAPATLYDFYNWEIKTTSTGVVHRREIFAGQIAWKSGFLIEDLEFLMQMAVIDPSGFRYIPDILLDYNQVYGSNGLCSGASYADYAHAFGTIYDLHKTDKFMTRPDVYLDRVTRYTALQEQVDRREIPPPQLKYFPEFWQP